MKIKTITCHDVYNSGASLQTYALMSYLENLNHEVEIIDYKPDYLSNHYKLLAVSNPKYETNIILKIMYIILKFPGRILALKNKVPYDQFKKDYLKITKTRYKSNDELKENLPQADVYIAGSDQIWNPTFKNGKDPAFYMDFVPDNKNKISYAASFAVEEFPLELRDKTSKMINRINSISVREKSGLDILSSMNIKDGVQVLDPVFLLDKEHWNSMCNSTNFNEKYLFVYDFDNNDLIKEIALKIANEKNLKIYTVFKSDYSDKCIKNIGPLDFITYIKNAEFIISNSFHGTAFSLIFEKDFCVVNRQEKINTRMRDLLSDLELDSRLVDKSYDISEISKNIYYDKVSKILNDKVEYSKLFLKSAIYNEELEEHISI